MSEQVVDGMDVVKRIETSGVHPFTSFPPFLSFFARASPPFLLPSVSVAKQQLTHASSRFAATGARDQPVAEVKITACGELK
jgi:hypothetical protein